MSCKGQARAHDRCHFCSDPDFRGERTCTHPDRWGTPAAGRCALYVHYVPTDEFARGLSVRTEQRRAARA